VVRDKRRQEMHKGNTRRNEPYRKRMHENERVLIKHQTVDMSIEDMQKWAREQRGQA
jgi:hypothetical protein